MIIGKSTPRNGKPRSSSDKLRKLLALFSAKDKVLITIDADPDSMASAMALKRILWRRAHTVTIAHFNEIRRFDNLTMTRLLKIPLVNLEGHLKEYGTATLSQFVTRNFEKSVG